MDGDAPGQIGMQHIEVASPHIRELIREESSIARAETAVRKEDDIGDDASSAILADKAIRYVGKLIFFFFFFFF
jgi:hypothetical protein